MFKRNLGIFYVILGVFNIIYFAACLITFGFIINFSSFFAFIGFILIVIGILKIKIKGSIFKGRSSNILNLFRLLIIIFLISFAAIESMLIYNSFEKSNRKTDFVVILGAAVRGKTMTLALCQRMEKGLEYLNQYPDIKVVVSGGKGPGEDIPEAEAMKDFLLKHGINQSRIIVEDKSKNTMENLKNTKKELQKLYGQRDFKIALVTNNFHVFRAKMLAERFGFKVYGIPAPVHPGIVLNSYVREYFAVIKSFIFDR
ncbi:YdcF family protein [Clostridium neuense]|uniref:YdcF family protein n=1 Tax=Clostridium neuense TaxID=1728934 RepID=A0ABW8TKJ3_9CLOT